MNLISLAACCLCVGPDALQIDCAPSMTVDPGVVVPLVLAEDFEQGKAARWEPTDPTAWTMGEKDGNHFYSLIKKQSDFKPPVRSPFNRALLKDVELSDVIIDAKVQSTIPDYGHRDLCLFFGYQDDSHLYYVHLGKQADDHANQIFIVNGEPRKKISLQSTEGTNWTDEWHHVRVIRNTQSGEIRVYFDNMDEPVMRAVDKTFLWGRVGIGSFDDTGNFDDVHIYGKRVERPAEK